MSFCSKTSYTLTSSAGARIWAESEYGTPPGDDFVTTFDANSDLQALNYVEESNPLPNLNSS